MRFQQRGPTDPGLPNRIRNCTGLRIIWIAAASLLLVIATTIVLVTGNRSSEEPLKDLFPRNLLGFVPITPEEITVSRDFDYGLGSVEHASAYYSAHSRYSDRMLGIELRVDAYTNEHDAARRHGSPYLSVEWGLDGFHVSWLNGGGSTSLSKADAAPTRDLCSWTVNGQVTEGALVYSWTDA